MEHLLHNFLSDMSAIFHMQSWGLAAIYLVTSIILPLFYIKQIKKYLKGTNGVGDLCFQTEIIQALLRVPALLYCISIANVPVFLSVFFDMVGRIAKLTTAYTVQKRYLESIATSEDVFEEIESPSYASLRTQGV